MVAPDPSSAAGRTSATCAGTLRTVGTRTTIPVRVRSLRAHFVDNRARTVGDFLAGHAVPGSLLSVVSAYFAIYGYGDLSDRLDGIGRQRFLYGDPRGVGAGIISGETAALVGSSNSPTPTSPSAQPPAVLRGQHGHCPCTLEAVM